MGGGGLVNVTKNLQKAKKMGKFVGRPVTTHERKKFIDKLQKWK